LVLDHYPHLIPNAELAVIPDAGHFTLSSEPNKVIAVVKHFLEKPENRIPVATARTGYHPGDFEASKIWRRIFRVAE
jgi:hypothetical protein